MANQSQWAKSKQLYFKKDNESRKTQKKKDIEMLHEKENQEGFKVNGK